MTERSRSCLFSRPSTLVAAVLLASSSATAVPRVLGYQGRLLNANGTAVTSVAHVTFSLHATPDEATSLWSEDQTIAVTDGYYSTFLGDVTPLPDGVFDGRDRYLQLVIEGETLTPRQRVGAVGYALRAEDARNVVGGSVDAASVSIGGNPVIDAGGRLVGNARYVAGSGLAIDDATQTVSITGACAPGQILKWNGTSWACAADGGASYGATSGGGLELNAGQFGMLTTCASGQVLKWSGTAWACSADQGTIYLAGAGLALNGKTFSLDDSCSTGQILKYNGSDWTCAADNVATAGPGLALQGRELSLIRTCQPDETLKWDGNTWACAPDRDTRYQAGTGLELTGTSLGLKSGCLNGQVLKFDGTTWGCANDANAGGTVTGLTAAPPLSASTGSLPAITIDKANATTDGYLAAADFATFRDKVASSDARLTDARPPTGAAGGDLVGNYPDPAVKAIQGRAVSNASPSSGQVLTWAGNAWSPATPSGGTLTQLSADAPLSVANPTTTPTLSLPKATGSADGYLAATDFAAFTAKIGTGATVGGDLGGQLLTPEVQKLRGRAVSNASPSTGQLLGWNGSAWAPATPNAGTVTQVDATGPLSVANGSTTPTISIARATGSADGFLSSSDWTTFNGKLGASSSVGGDLSGTVGLPTVTRLLGRDLSPTPPSTGQVLAWNGSAWAASSTASGTVSRVTANAPLSVTNGASTPDLSISQATGTTPGFLTSADWTTFNQKIGASTTAGGDLGGTMGTPTVNGLRGRPLAATAPNAGEVVTWNGTTWTPAAVPGYTAGAGLTLSSNQFGANFTTSGGDNGTATTVARGDHLHDGRYYTRDQIDALNTGSALRKYTVMLAMRTGTGCPTGWNLEKFTDLMGTNSYVYTEIGANGLTIGGITSPSYGQEYLYQGIAASSGITRFCWKSFQTRGNPYTHLLSGTASLTCPSGYIQLPASELKGNNNYVYQQSTDQGFYLGYIDTWARDATAYQNGYQYRYWRDTVQTNKFCMKIMGVEDDTNTRFGVYPVVLGVKNASACPTSSGYTYIQTSGQLANMNDDWSYQTMTDNSALMGSSESHSHGGSNYNYAYWHGSYQINYCFKFYAATGRPNVTLRPMQYVTCPTGTLSFNFTDLNGWNGNAYQQQTGTTFYLGGLYSNGYVDYLNGYWYNNWTGTVSRYCLQVDNVSAFP